MARVQYTEQASKRRSPSPSARFSSPIGLGDAFSRGPTESCDGGPARLSLRPLEMTLRSPHASLASPSMDLDPRHISAFRLLPGMTGARPRRDR